MSVAWLVIKEKYLWPGDELITSISALRLNATPGFGFHSVYLGTGPEI